MELINYVAKLSEGLAVSGVQDTVRALNEGRVQRLIVCANFPPSVGWQCHDCMALCAGTSARPENCVQCGSTRIHTADLRAAMIARAYRLGCSIEIMSRSPELERVGGIGALLHETTLQPSAKERPEDQWEREAALGVR